jgi:hypothetical protein
MDRAQIPGYQAYNYWRMNVLVFTQWNILYVVTTEHTAGVKTAVRVTAQSTRLPPRPAAAVARCSPGRRRCPLCLGPAWRPNLTTSACCSVTEGTTRNEQTSHVQNRYRGSTGRSIDRERKQEERPAQRRFSHISSATHRPVCGGAPPGPSPVGDNTSKQKRSMSHNTKLGSN